MNPSLQPTANSQQLTAATPLPGWINTYYRHHNGKKLGPYFVRRWKVGTRLYKEYVKPADLERVRAACLAHREKRQHQREANKKIHTLLGNWNYLGRIGQRLDKRQDIGQEHHEHIRLIAEQGMYVPGRPPLKTPRARTPHPFPFDKLSKDQILSRIRANLKTAMRFMVPNFSKRDTAKMEKQLKHAFNTSQPDETADQRWSRWKTGLAKPPKPRPAASHIELPPWITAQEIDAMLDAKSSSTCGGGGEEYI